MMTEQTPEIPEKPVQPEVVSEINPKKTPLKIVLLVILGLVIMAGAVYAGMQIGKKQVEGGLVNKITPILIPQPTEVIDETANWKTYRNEKYGFEIKYPSELTGYILSTEKSFNIDPGMSDVPLLTIAYYQTNLISENWWNQNGKKEFPWLFNTAFNKTEITKGIKATEVIGQRRSPGGATLSARLLLISHNNVLFTVWGSSLMQDTLMQDCSNNYDQILSTFKFTGSNSTSISKDEAVKLARSLDDVKAYLARVPNGRVEFDHENEDKTKWIVHVYEVKNDHTATFNWYEINKITRKINKVF